MSGQMPPVVHGTYVIERQYGASRERVFRAWADPATKRRWFGNETMYENGEFTMDFRVGGQERASFKAMVGEDEGAWFTNETAYLDIVDGERIVFAYTMTMNGTRFSASLVTVELRAPASGGSGTSLVFTEQGAFFEHADGPEIRQIGWNSLLDRLTQELEASVETTA